ncbi:universal stress protein [Streptomyces sp. NPDC006997]|uniref:universal stress protein n=1 Tax=Streptomyces sp. NPDC006997 TaxID=3155356 RepID=UPI0033CC5D44
MYQPVTTGIDGSAASLAAAAWAAREAELRGTPLCLVAAWPAADGSADGTAEAAARRRWATRSLELAADRLRHRHPRLDIRTQLSSAPPLRALLAAGGAADLLVLGSRGLGCMSAPLLGSTGAQAAARADFPITLVRPAPDPGEPPDGPVLLALDAERHPDDTVTAFAFEAAALHGIPLRALHVWTPSGPARSYPVVPRRHGHAARASHAERELTEYLLPWREKFPNVRVEELCFQDVPAGAVAAATRHAALAVLGHRVRPAAGPGLGAVAQVAVREAPCPVTLVPHS